eukprot:768817-Hanusia_phi.AAC.11
MHPPLAVAEARDQREDGMRVQSEHGGLVASHQRPEVDPTRPRLLHDGASQPLVDDCHIPRLTHDSLLEVHLFTHKDRRPQPERG